MRDIDMAVELLEKEKLALAIVKDGKAIFSSSEKGIKPLYTAVKEHKNKLEGSSIADRVTGRAAAMICSYAGIKELKTKLISNNAINVLRETNIIYEYDECVPYIKNRDKTGMCPIESLSLKINVVDDLLRDIQNFMESTKKVK